MNEKKVNQTDVCRLICERIANEGWSNAEKYKDNLEIILERRSIESEEDLSLLLIVANAFLQKVTLSELENNELGLKITNLIGDEDLDECDSFSPI